MQPSNKVCLVVYPNQSSSSSPSPVKYTNREKKVTKQLRHLVTRIIDIKSTLKDGTQSIFFREITEFKGKVPVDVIGACSPLGIITGGKIEF
jgi:hypothetical protein